jgi:hypothetical protein|tara:strand:+ start:334 stop:534 length:201 start_codon:yes stop_codon:yes gene_type:complete
MAGKKPKMMKRGGAPKMMRKGGTPKMMKRGGAVKKTKNGARGGANGMTVAQARSFLKGKGYKVTKA